jgi:hypothetical protein
VSPTSVPANVEPAWRAELGGKVTPLVIANGRVFVAQTDRHVVHCLHTDSGERLWTFTAGGRVDSPPTIWQGRAIFGCRDGWVYCVGAEDGNLLWRFRVAPRDRRIVSFDRLESAWPVPGSVLVMEGQVYCVAGRSIFLDGGMRLCRLDAATGKLLSETRLSGYAPDSGKQLEQYQRPRGFGMPGLLPDVLSSDGEHVFLRHAVFDLDGRQEETRKAHLFSPVGFLDDTWWHRSYWLWGDDFRAGWAGWWQVGNEVPAGRLLVCTDDEVLGFGRSFMPHGNSGQWNVGESYHVFAAPKQFERPQPAVTDAKGKKRRRNKAVTGRSIVPPRWSHEATLEARAMVLADDILFLAGPLGDTHRSLDAFTGREGILLRAVSIEDGTPLADRRLEAMPRFDGLAAAGGKLYLATADGQVVCFAGGE